MPEPIWIDPRVVVAIHARQLAEHGGETGVRDPGLLESALARPKNLWAYEAPPPNLAHLAAAYAFGLSRNPPFIDGNKRTALVVALSFLRLNGHDINCTEAEIYTTFLNLAEGALPENQLAHWFSQNLTHWPTEK